ncbi:MAG: hypothetical protein FJ128_08815 [Deltaproteobacteria bacterium]|nr:hypothetical protein [Deltaproteobacteria bacterium]
MKEMGILQSAIKTAALSQDKGRILEESLVEIIFSHVPDQALAHNFFLGRGLAGAVFHHGLAFLHHLFQVVGQLRFGPPALFRLVLAFATPQQEGYEKQQDDDLPYSAGMKFHGVPLVTQLPAAPFLAHAWGTAPNCAASAPGLTVGVGGTIPQSSGRWQLPRSGSPEEKMAWRPQVPVKSRR